MRIDKTQPFALREQNSQYSNNYLQTDVDSEGSPKRVVYSK